jgi:hypothetical protein
MWRGFSPRVSSLHLPLSRYVQSAPHWHRRLFSPELQNVKYSRPDALGLCAQYIAYVVAMHASYLPDRGLCMFCSQRTTQTEPVRRSASTLSLRFLHDSGLCSALVERRSTFTMSERRRKKTERSKLDLGYYGQTSDRNALEPSKRRSSWSSSADTPHTSSTM